MHTYIYIYLVLFCFMDIFWSFILSGSVSLLIIGTSRENYHLCGIYRVRVTGFLSLFSSLSCSTSLLQYKLSSWILILLICLFLCHCKWHFPLFQEARAALSSGSFLVFSVNLIFSFRNMQLAWTCLFISCIFLTVICFFHVFLPVKCVTLIMC